MAREHLRRQMEEERVKEATLSEDEKRILERMRHFQKEQQLALEKEGAGKEERQKGIEKLILKAAADFLSTKFRESGIEDIIKQVFAAIGKSYYFTDTRLVLAYNKGGLTYPLHFSLYFPLSNPELVFKYERLNTLWQQGMEWIEGIGLDSIRAQEFFAVIEWGKESYMTTERVRVDRSEWDSQVVRVKTWKQTTLTIKRNDSGFSIQVGDGELVPERDWSKDRIETELVRAVALAAERIDTRRD